MKTRSPIDQGEAQSLGRYSTLADELELACELLGELHSQRENFTRAIGDLKVEADQLGDQLLAVTNMDAGERLNEELGRTESAIKLNQTRLAALNRKIDVEERSLQQKLPLVPPCFQRLYVFRRAKILEAHRESLLRFVHETHRQAPEIETLAAFGKEYVDAASLAPSGAGTYILSGPLTDDERTPWNQTPLTRADKVAHLIKTVGELVSKARLLIAACRSYEGVPRFDLEPPPPPAPPETHPEWNEALAQDPLFDRLLAASGKKRSDLTEREIAILSQSVSGHNSYLREPVQHSEFATGSPI